MTTCSHTGRATVVLSGDPARYLCADCVEVGRQEVAKKSRNISTWVGRIVGLIVLSPVAFVVAALLTMFVRLAIDGFIWAVR